MLQTGGTHGPGVKSKFLRGTCQSFLLSSGETWPSLNAIMGTNKMAHLTPPLGQQLSADKTSRVGNH